MAGVLPPGTVAVRPLAAFRRILLPLLIGAASGCAGLAPAAEEPEPEPPVGWRAGVAEHLGLWYHGLATVLGPAERPDSVVLPHYEPGYPDSIAAVKRRRGFYPTALDRRSGELRQLFRGDRAYRGLEFVPLYFRSAEALFSAIELWQRAGGDPRLAGSTEGARVVAFLSTLFPRARHRQVVGEWAALLREEARVFYGAYWQEQAPVLRERASAVERDWETLAPALASFLDYAQLENGELFLVPALSVEGRIVTRGVDVPRAAVLSPPAGRPDHAVLAFVHELLYPLVGDVIRDYVAPVRIRELGEDVLAARAAIRGGAMLLERADPARVTAYRRLYLRAAGRTAPAGEEALEAAFEEAFPLPPELERGLADLIRQALAGI